MLHKQLVAPEVRPRKLLLKLPNMRQKLPKALPICVRARKYNILSYASPKQPLPLSRRHIGPRILIVLPNLLKSLNRHLCFLSCLPAFQKTRSQSLHGK